MDKTTLEKLLCISGYLPPRNEEEMEAFEKVYSKIQIDKTFKVDVDSIINKDEQNKMMACKWFRNGGECGKGLPGTPCELEGCVAWEHSVEEKK